MRVAYIANSMDPDQTYMSSLVKIHNVCLCHIVRERSGSVVECLTRYRGAAGSSLTDVTALWSLSTFIPA